MRIELKPFQFDFVYSRARYPAFAAGWGTGKTMCAISRGLLYSELIPDNLGVIFRKTARSLTDSTLRDFEKYTGRKVDSKRNCELGDGSVIMFRHLDEINDINQQNINLGWFYIEQGEELDTDREFFMLWGRLRRKLFPTEEFERLGLPVRSGWVVANAGDNWMRPLWKDKRLEDSELIEATTFDNADNLPEDFIESMRTLERAKPEIYEQYVKNSWEVNADRFVLFKESMFEALEGVNLVKTYVKRLVACDPAAGGDRCVVKVFEDTEAVETYTFYHNDTMKVVGEIMILMKKHGIETLACDSIGIGKGICDRVNELGKTVIEINSAAQASDPEQFANLRAEMWWAAMDQVLAREIAPIESEDVRKELKAVRYKVVNSNGKIQLEPKADTKKRLGQSPDEGDCFIYGLHGLRQMAGPGELNVQRLPRKRPVFHGAGGW